MVTPLPFFPMPYPDETLYSVLCRYHLRAGQPAYQSVSEEIFGRRVILNTYTPQTIGMLAEKIPPESGMTADYLIRATTMFPYFSPFLNEEKKKIFQDYMRQAVFIKENRFFSLGTGKLRQPKSLFLRFCPSCWRADVDIYGEPYWHRTHQLSGVMICHHHQEPLWDSPIFITMANKNFYAASLEWIQQSRPCGSFTDKITGHLMALSRDSEWLLKHGHLCDPYKNTLRKYDLHFIESGFRGIHGKTKHKRIFQSIQEFYDEEFLKLVNAFDDYAEASWMSRITHFPDSMLHPMYHVLMMGLLTGSAESFLSEEAPEFYPYGEGPWPCRNRICPHHLQDVIETIDVHYHQGFYRAVFCCPHCGMIYRRKNVIPKKEQYSGIVYIKEYGPLWEAKLRECLVDLGLTPRETCRILGCDFYTVNKHALRLGILTAEQVTFPRKPAKVKDAPAPPACQISFNEAKKSHRKKWVQLLADNPGMIRSRLLLLDPATHMWLRMNDVEWYEKYSPPVSTVMDWSVRDAQNLELVQSAIGILRKADGRPSWNNKNAVIQITGIHQLNSEKAMVKLPLTMAYLAENLESADEWRMRKIIWAIGVMREQGESITLHKIGAIAAISPKVFCSLKEYALKHMQICCE